MAEKEIARRVVETMPDDATLDDIMHALYLRVKFDRGEREIREGKGISQEAAKRRLSQWAR